MVILSIIFVLATSVYMYLSLELQKEGVKFSPGSEIS